MIVTKIFIVEDVTIVQARRSNYLRFWVAVYLRYNFIHLVLLKSRIGIIIVLAMTARHRRHVRVMILSSDGA